MWQLAVNVVLSFTFSWTVGRVVATPADVDPRIRPRGRVSPRGFPCVELHLATVLCTAAIIKFPAERSIITCSLLALTTLASFRLYALTHFPSQLAMSVLLGAATVPALQTLATMLWPRGVPADVHIIGGVALGFAFLSFMAYRAEENGAPFLRIRKCDCESQFYEYIRMCAPIEVATSPQHFRRTCTHFGKLFRNACSSASPTLCAQIFAHYARRRSVLPNSQSKRSSVKQKR